MEGEEKEVVKAKGRKAKRVKGKTSQRCVHASPSPTVCEDALLCSGRERVIGSAL